MKRIAACLIVLFSLVMLSSSGAETLRHVSDLANVLSDEEEITLQTQAEELYLQTGFDVILHTTRDSRGRGAEDYTYDYYYEFRDVEKYPNGSLFAVMFDIRESYEATHGSGIPLLTHRESNELRSVVQNKLSNGEYFHAMLDYLDYVRRVIIPPTPIEYALTFAPYMLIGGLVIGLVYALYLKSKLKIAKFKQGAEGYVLKDSLNLTQSEDLYLYQTVTRTKIQTSSGGSGGGGFSTGSRGGSSFGGRSGGKF